MNFCEWDPGTRGVTGISVHQYGELEATRKGFKGLESTDLIEITSDLIQNGELGIEGFWCFLGVWSRNLQGMILNQKGEVAALEFKEQIYGSVFLRVWKVSMGTRPSSPPASVRSVQRQLVMEKEQNSRRRRVSQTPNLMPPNLRSSMTTQEVEGLCEQLACSIFNFNFVFQFNKLYERLIEIFFGYFVGSTCPLCFIVLPYVGLNWNKTRLFGFWFWLGCGGGFRGLSLTVSKHQRPCLQDGFTIEELLCLVSLNHPQISHVCTEVFELVEIGQKDSRMVLFLRMGWSSICFLIRMKWWFCVSVVFFQTRELGSLAQEVQQLWRGDINGGLRKSKAEVLFFRRVLVVQYYIPVKVFYVLQDTHKVWYFLMFNKNRISIISNHRGWTLKVARGLISVDDQEFIWSGLERIWIHGRWEVIFNTHMLIEAVRLQWGVRFWSMLQIIYFGIVKDQVYDNTIHTNYAECILVTQGFLTPDCLARMSFLKKNYDSVELEL